MKYSEEYGDLFDVDIKKYYLCHCISADFKLGMGIAAEFDRRYHMRLKLNQYYLINSDYPVALLIDNVFNLVTKQFYWHKPTMQTLRGALEDMRQQMLRLDIHHLAMPLIGSGLDKLNWKKVSDMIKEIFKDDDIEIRVIIRE